MYATLIPHQTENDTRPTKHCPWDAGRGPSWLLRNNGFLKKTIKENAEEIPHEGKECPNQKSSRGADPVGQASHICRFKTRPMWPSRWLRARGQGTGVRSQKNQGPEMQVNFPPYYVSPCNKGVSWEANLEFEVWKKHSLLLFLIIMKIKQAHDIKT